MRKYDFKTKAFNFNKDKKHNEKRSRNKISLNYMKIIISQLYKYEKKKYANNIRIANQLEVIKSLILGYL